MKILLTGASGFVGGEVLRQLLEARDVERVTVLVRRPLGRAHERLGEIVHDDFARYDAPLRARLADHDACIWTIGGKATDVADLAAYERITHGFTLALARVVAESKHEFAFCYLSGMGADPSESAWLPWERATRHLKGRTERDLFRLSEEHPRFHPYALRPAGILPRATSPIVARLLAPIAIRVDVLARAILRIARDGADRATVSNRVLRRLGA